jgi:hypothetical protein
LIGERALTRTTGATKFGVLFRRASAIWLEARAALAQIVSAGNDRVLSFRIEGMNGR